MVSACTFHSALNAKGVSIRGFVFIVGFVAWDFRHPFLPFPFSITCFLFKKKHPKASGLTFWTLTTWNLNPDNPWETSSGTRRGRCKEELFLMSVLLYIRVLCRRWPSQALKCHCLKRRYALRYKAAGFGI